MASIIKADTLQSTTANVFVLNSSGTEYARFDSTGVFQLTNPTTFPAGTAALPSITATGDTNTGVYFPAADTIAFTEGGVESMRIDSAGNVGIGTSPAATSRLQVSSAGSTRLLVENTTNSVAVRIQSETASGLLQTDTNHPLNFATNNGAVAMQIDTSGNLKFNSGYGTAATAYGCRAWVNFNAVGTIAIRASGNVSSITDNGISDYTINFTTAMPDANYSVVATIGDSAVSSGGSAAAVCMPKTYAIGSVRVLTGYGNSMTPNDWSINNFAIFR